MTIERTFSFFLLLQIIAICHGFSAPSSSSTKAENVAAAVLVPGYLTGADELKSLQATLNKQGLPTVIVPMPNWHWLPVMGGRSVRPILERIEFTVQHLIAKLEESHGEEDLHDNFPSFQYNLIDAWKDFQENPGGVAEVGGSANPDDYPKHVQPRGHFPLPELKSGKKVALIGHSAGGWISRIYLSDQEYGAKRYDGARHVHSLVTLGTPHASAPGPAFAGISWINEKDQASNELSTSTKNTNKLRSLCVAGKGFPGDKWGGLTQGAYSFCCPDASDGTQYDGDGMTPIFSSLAMPNSEPLVLKQDKVNHFAWTEVGWIGKQVAPEMYEDMETNNGLWYGSEEVVAEWLPWIMEAVTNKSTSEKDGVMDGTKK